MYKLTDIGFSTGSFNLTVDNLHLKKGNIYAAIGPNGSGKTTFLNVLGFLLKPDNGEILFNEKTINYLSQKSLVDTRRNISYNMQHPYLLNTTVYKNIACGLKIRGFSPQLVKQKVEHIISVFLIEDIVYKHVRELSGGEYQKVALARSLVSGGQVLLLDEPFAGLDGKSAAMLKDLLSGLNKTNKKTIILATHLENQAYELTKNILSVDCGRVRNAFYKNVFSGSLTGGANEIKKLKLNDEITLKLNSAETGNVTVTIEPENILLSTTRVKSSALNNFEGKITKTENFLASVAVFVNAGGVNFLAFITETSFNKMGLEISKPVWVTFKANAVKIL